MTFWNPVHNLYTRCFELGFYFLQSTSDGWVRANDPVVPEDGDFEFRWECDGAPGERDQVVVFYPGFVAEVGGHEEFEAGEGGGEGSFCG